MPSVLALFTFSMSLAYLDPVTGTFIVQAIIGGLLGGWYVIKKYYNRIHAYFTGAVEEKDESA